MKKGTKKMQDAQQTTKTTAVIPTDLWREVNHAMVDRVDRKLMLKDVINEGLELWLAKEAVRGRGNLPKSKPA